MRKWLLLVLAIVLVAGIYVYKRISSNLSDRFPGYQLSLNIEEAEPQKISAGFAALPITPQVIETWIDANGDAAFREDDGDTYEDVNGNGQFDAVWMAGFGTARAANGVHDELWARTMVLDDGASRLAIVSLDAIGFSNDSVIRVRERVAELAPVTYVVVCSTHVHEAPDLIGLWGPTHFHSGLDKRYEDFVIEQAALSVAKAVSNLKPARLRVAQDLENPSVLVTDSRLPKVLDPGLRLIQAVDTETDQTLGVLVAWANHPETTWSKNLLITSDFPHYVREGIEEGVSNGDRTLAEGLGGTAVYVNGAIGGLMTTNESFAISDPFSGEDLLEPSFEKARAQGQQLALYALQALRGNAVETIETGSLRIRAETLHIPLANPIFKLASGLGVIDRGFVDLSTIRTEIAAWTLSSLSFLAIPGEIYPEIVEGGIESPEGQDFPVQPIEVPGLRSQMPGRYRFVLGLANDEIGYIIPKSEWDEEAPYLYGAEKSPYGEINSTGPEAGPVLHRELLSLLEEIR